MICSKCETKNAAGAKFCVKCGSPLELKESVKPTLSVKTNDFNIMEYIYMIISIILKPADALKEETKKLEDLKKSAILALVISVVATIISLLRTMYNLVKVTSHNYFTGKTTTTWVFDNLKELNYIKTFGSNLLMYLGIIALIAGIYYLASLVIKKQVNFAKLLGITSLALIPVIVCSLILTPIVSIINTSLGMLVSVVGFIYTFIILYEGLNQEICLEGNNKYYFNVACLSILIVVIYFIITKIFVSSIYGNLNSILNLFD